MGTTFSDESFTLGSTKCFSPIGASVEKLEIRALALGELADHAHIKLSR